MNTGRREEVSILVLTLLTLSLFLLSACGSAVTSGGRGSLTRARKPVEPFSPVQSMSSDSCFSLPYGSDLLSCIPGQSLAFETGDDPGAVVKVSAGNYTMQGVVESGQTQSVSGGISEMMLIEPFSLKISINGSGTLSMSENSRFSLSAANTSGRNITMTLIDGTRNTFTVSGTLLPLPGNLLLGGTGFSIQAIGKTGTDRSIRMDAVLIPDNGPPSYKKPPAGEVVGKS
jgi:hypothetical protein